MEGRGAGPGREDPVRRPSLPAIVPTDREPGGKLRDKLGV